MCRSREREDATARPAGPAPRMRTSVGFSCELMDLFGEDIVRSVEVYST